MRQLGWRKARSGGLVFHTVDNRSAKGDRTNGEGCGLIHCDPGIPGGYKDARYSCRKKKKNIKKVDAPYKREAVLVLLLLLLPRKNHENNEGNVVGKKKYNNKLNLARPRRSAAETSVVTAMTL